MRRSTGRSTGSSHVRSRLNTRVMNRPSSGVTARIASRNTPICSQPLTVISELLGFQQRIGQVHEQTQRHDETDDVVDGHEAPPPSRSQPATYATASAKKTIVMPM